VQDDAENGDGDSSFGMVGLLSVACVYSKAAYEIY
jgi:hypothetical protein